MRRSVIGESWLTNADAKRVNVLVRFEISPLRRSAHRPGAVVPPDDNPDRAGEPRLLVHVGAAHARPAGTRGVASPARARRQSRKSRPRAGTPEWGLPQPWSAGSGPAGRRAGQPGDWPPVPNSPWCRRPIPKDRAALAPGETLPGQLEAAAGDSELRLNGGRCGTRPREMHADPPVHCALPWQRPTLGGPTQSPPYTEERVPRVGPCECKRHGRSDPWQIGWTALPRCDLAYGRGGCTLTRG